MKKFNNEFKANAVSLVRAEGVKIGDVASDLGVGISTLKVWLSKHDQGRLIKTEKQTREEEEIKRLVIPSSSSRVSQQIAVDDDIQEVVSVKTEPDQEAGAEGEELEQFDAGEDYEEGNEGDGQCDDTHRYLKLSMDDTALLEQGGAGVVDDAAKDQVKNFEDLDQFFGPKLNGLYSCGICLTFTSRSSANLRMHLEAKHFPGTFVHNCQVCGEECKSKNALIGHTRRKHK